MKESALTKAALFGLRYGAGPNAMKDWIRERTRTRTQLQRTRRYHAKKKAWKKMLRLPFLFNFNEAEQRVLREMRIDGTSTGRFDSSRPNLSNIPQNSIILVKHP